MNEFEVVTVIGRPAEAVFAVVRDVAKTPLWTPGLLEVRRTSEGPLGVGATLVYVGTFLGRRYESPVACTGFAENKQFATATSGGPFHLEVDQMLEPAGAGTRLRSAAVQIAAAFSSSPSRWSSGWPKSSSRPEGRTSRPSWKSTRSSEALGVGSSSGAYPRTHGGRRGRAPVWG
jgi:Polyketide cyclase / dehydrase and lipid transport